MHKSVFFNPIKYKSTLQNAECFNAFQLLSLNKMTPGRCRSYILLNDRPNFSQNDKNIFPRLLGHRL